MQDSVDRFLMILESERGFSINTISAYRNDLAQFVAYMQQPPTEDRQAPVAKWGELTDGHLSIYLLHLRSRDYACFDRGPEDGGNQVVLSVSDGTGCNARQSGSGHDVAESREVRPTGDHAG